MEESLKEKVEQQAAGQIPGGHTSSGRGFLYVIACITALGLFFYALHGISMIFGWPPHWFDDDNLSLLYRYHPVITIALLVVLVANMVYQFSVKN